MRNFSSPDIRNEWIKLSHILYNKILEKISIDKTIIFFGHSAGGALSQLIVYQFFINHTIDSFKIGLITSRVFPIWEKKKI